MAVAHVTDTLIIQAHREAMRVSPAEGAMALCDVLTPRLAAYVTSVDATRTVALGPGRDRPACAPPTRSCDSSRVRTNPLRRSRPGSSA